MAPLADKLSSHETSENKAAKFSFRWLLKRSKSSKSAKEMAYPDKHKPQAVTVSKSCDSGIASFSAMDKCSTFLLWKLLPSRGKALMGQDKAKKDNQPRSFKTSFSCSDVSYMLQPSRTAAVTSSRSSYSIPVSSEMQAMQSKHSGLGLCAMRKHNASVDYLNLPKPGEHVIHRDFTPTVYQLTLCKLCLSMIPAQNMYSLADCGCCFCVTCMQQYLYINIKEGNVSIMCPDAECTEKGRILVSEIQDLVGDEIFYKFQKFKLNSDVESDPCRTWCPTPGCETICRFQPSGKPDGGVSVHCLNCKLTFCSSCKLKWHGEKTCEEIKLILQEDDEFNVSDEEDAIIKRCPNCRVPIERDEGCAQMMCKCCKHVFCWHCLASLDDDFLLRHYDKGPCRNKLGHSRASMVWHRTQVVGIFAGLSFLLLVASPILLLAAPCLLCCRCKNCKFFYEETTLI